MMNTLPRSLPIALLASSILISGLTIGFASAQEKAADLATTQRPAKVSASDLALSEISPSKYLRFGHLTTENGLSNDTIWGIAQDNYGFMWFGTFSGLNRYDGSDIKVYRHNPDDPFSLSADGIRELLGEVENKV